MPAHDSPSLIERGAARTIRAIDAAATRLYGVAWNPVHQTGTVAVAMLLALLATGLYLVLFYRVGAPASSVAHLAADPWLGSWMRTLHRYTSDLFIIAAGLHLLRMVAQRRSWGPRTLAWTSGLMLLGAGVVCAWTGFVMAWDTFGERLARDGARLLDVVPIFSEPLSRIFAGDGPVPSAFFFVNLFVHIGVPLLIGVLLWLHVSRLARPVLLPPKRLTWAMLAVLTGASVVLPATLGPAADPFHLPPNTPLDVIAAWWLPISEGLSPGVVWLLGGVVTLMLFLVPRFTRRERAERWAPSTVDSRLCTGCNQCPQDCPWEAITMVARDDDRPTLVAQVDPSRCVSCGVCAGSCAPMGVGPPGRSGRDQLVALREQWRSSVEASEPHAIVAICCSEAPASHRARLRDRGAIVHEVICVGNLHSSVLERLLHAGTAGVIVFGCPPRDCAGREGPKWLRERLFNEREAELQARVDRRRVRVATMAPGNLSHTLADYDGFARDLAALRPSAPGVDLEVDTACERIQVEEGVS